mmetsp:Transcript_13494/g.36010  ORF Transcript_13494/g.36010 Transcript_13494/m.36010 type:complete len:328 (+) Transcript_13494:120-1103(+)
MDDAIRDAICDLDESVDPCHSTADVKALLEWLKEPANFRCCWRPQSGYWRSLVLLRILSDAERGRDALMGMLDHQTVIIMLMFAASCALFQVMAAETSSFADEIGMVCSSLAMAVSLMGAISIHLYSVPMRFVPASQLLRANLDSPFDIGFTAMFAWAGAWFMLAEIAICMVTSGARAAFCAMFVGFSVVAVISVHVADSWLSRAHSVQSLHKILVDTLETALEWRSQHGSPKRTSRMAVFGGGGREANKMHSWRSWQGGLVAPPQAWPAHRQRSAPSNDLPTAAGNRPEAPAFTVDVGSQGWHDARSPEPECESQYQSQSHRSMLL